MRCHGHAISPQHEENTKTNEPCQASRERVNKKDEHTPFKTIKQKLEIDNKDIKMKINLSIANKPEITMLIDTGATLTLLSSNSVRKGTTIYKSKSVNLIGINGEENKLKSLGLIHGIIEMENCKIQQEFQIVDKTVNMNADGILGYDFLKKYNAKLNLMDDTIELSIPTSNEIYSEPTEHTDNKEIDEREDLPEDSDESETESEDSESEYEENENKKKFNDYAEIYDNYYEKIDELFEKMEKTEIKHTTETADSSILGKPIEHRTFEIESDNSSNKLTTSKMKKKIKNRDYYLTDLEKHIKTLSHNCEAENEIKHKIISNGKNIQIELKLEDTEKPVRLNINTGIYETIIQSSALNEKTKIYDTRRKETKNEMNETKEIKILMNEYELPFKAKITNEKICDDADGFLGCEFMNKYNAKINFKDEIIQIDKAKAKGTESKAYILENTEENKKIIKKLKEKFRDYINIKQIEDLRDFIIEPSKTEIFILRENEIHVQIGPTEIKKENIQTKEK